MLFIRPEKSVNRSAHASLDKCDTHGQSKYEEEKEVRKRRQRVKKRRSKYFEISR